VDDLAGEIGVKKDEPLQITIRPEVPADRRVVRDVLLNAFPGPLEAELVDRVRENPAPRISLVALVDDRVIGYVLFTRVTVHAPEEEGGASRGQGGVPWTAIALGPMAVRPEHQSQGVGLALGFAGLEECRRKNEKIVFVLGHPPYYPRFGFRPAAEYGLWYAKPDIGPEFMVLELEPGALAGRRGEVRYLPEFDDA
jgi:putative acetyltransferase